MATITLNDLNAQKSLTSEQLASVNGGFYYWLYRPVVSYYSNPFAYSLQSSWASTGLIYDQMNQSFLDYLRS